MSRRAIYFALILFVCAISAVVGISASNTGKATLPAPQNVTLLGVTEGIDVRWNIPPGSDEVVNYQIAYQAMERQRADSWTYMWTQGKVSTHLIRHLAGGYEFRVYVRSCSNTHCSLWALGGDTWTKKPQTPRVSPIPIPTPMATPTAIPTWTPTPTPSPAITVVPYLIEYWTFPIGEYRTYGTVPEYTIRMNWTQSPSLGIRVAWQEDGSSGSWNLLAPDKVTIRNLKPSTTYSVKAQICDHEGKYVEKGQCGPWSKTYSVVSRDEQPLAPTCILSEGEIGLQDHEYDYLGIVTATYWRGIAYLQHTPRVVFTNLPGEWKHGIQLRRYGDRLRLTIGSDKVWEIMIGRGGYFSDYRIVASGALNPNTDLKTAVGEANDIEFRLRANVPQDTEHASVVVVNGVSTDTKMPREVYDWIRDHTHLNIWSDAISSVDGTPYKELGTGRSCDGR